jgi:hypothetical protein
MDPAERSRLLAQLQRRLQAALQPLLQALFDALEARLFDLAERSRIASQQQVFFEGLRECRRKRTDLEHDFLEGVADALRPPRAGGAPLVPATLTLVGHQELEETLTLSAMAVRAAQRMPHAIDALDLRLGRLLDQPPDPKAPGRLSPQALGTLFRAACQRLDVGIEVRLVAFNAFGQHVLDALEPIYADLNRELVAAGVLPAIAVTPPRPVHAPAPARPAAAEPPAETPSPARGRARTVPAPTASAVAGPGEASQRADSLHALLEEVRTLLRPAETRGGPDFANAAQQASAALQAASAAVRALESRLVLDALDRLGRFDQPPAQLKPRLMETSRSLGADPQAHLAPQDEDTVDLVAMVFDYVRNDPTLPKPMQALLTRLQVPFLKAALSDPELMRADDHPARRLIDALGEFALGWSPSTDPEQQLLERVSQMVERLLQPQAAGRAAFQHALDDLRDHLELGRHRAELAEQRAVEAALGRERLRIARSRVASMLERRLSRYMPLPWIRQVLRGPWANYLVLLWLRHGESGEGFRDALRFVDELLWCDEHGSASQDDARLRNDEEQLEAQLRAGLSTVAYHDREIERLAGELRQFITSLRRRRPAPVFLYEIDPKLGVSDFAQQWAEPELEEQPAATDIDSDLLGQLRALAPGTWFEFGGEGAGERAKLSWTSPFSGRQLFVNRNGLRVGERTPEQLADEIENGLARILETSRLLQRALQALIARLRSQAAPRRA